MYQNCTDKRQGELVMERIRNTEIEEMYYVLDLQVILHII